jgi:hypothetical protein
VRSSIVASRRIDKCLWAARWFKTRALAQKASEFGRIRSIGIQTKPASDARRSRLFQSETHFAFSRFHLGFHPMRNPNIHGGPVFALRQPQPTVARILRFRALRFAILGLLVSAFCTSCADLTEVARFAASAKAASTGYSAIIDDFAASATRRALYVSDEEKPNVLKSAQVYRDEQAQMLAAQKPLVDYINALAAISTDSTAAAGKSKSSASDSASAKSTAAKKSPSSSDASTDPTASDLEKLGMKPAEATAAVGLANKLVAALTAGYRSDKAGKAIHDSNQDLQDYLQGLEHIVGTDYPLVLNNERIGATKYYENLLAQYGDKEPLAAITTRAQMRQALDGIDKREQAAQAYVKILTDIGQGHQKLYDAGEKISTAQLFSIVEPYISDIYTQSMKVAKAF